MTTETSAHAETSDTRYDLSAILTAHGEGAMASVSWQSLMQTCQVATDAGVSVEKVVVLDRPNNYTRLVFEDMAEEHDVTVIETDFGDQGMVRNQAVEQCAGEYVAFIDGDDLWGDNWLLEAYRFLQSSSPNTIAHPEFNWFFQGVASVLIGIDQEDELFAEDFLRVANYWDAMCMTHRNVHLANPYCQRRIKEGFAFEDWHWNCRTYENGCLHKIVPETVHFKRRRQNSQTLEASGSKSLMPATDLTAYDWQQVA